LIYGYFSSAFVSLPPTSIASTPPGMSRYGARFYISAICNAIESLVGPPIAGSVIRDGDDYLGASIFAELIVVAASISIAISRFLILRQSKRQSKE